jgi:hypothetical protein
MPRSLEDHFFGPGPKRILALDGGGVRGVMTCAVLEALEASLRRRLPEAEQEAFRLCDYFDLIGGTSTGAIVATWLALGHTASETRTLYERFAKRVFRNASLRSWVGLTSKFDVDHLRTVIEENFQDYVRRNGLAPDYALHLDDRLIRTGLALFAKRIDRASPWIVHNNPRGKFWDPDGEVWRSYYSANPGLRGTPNATFRLSSFVQASASAPYYLDPISQTIAKDIEAPFIDGGVSPHNNPAQQLFLMSTLRWRGQERPEHMPAPANSPFGFGWETGEDQLLLVSVGTGTWRKEPKGLFKNLAAHRALHALTTMIDDASNAGVAWLQALSRPARPAWLNYEVEDMTGLRIVQEPLLRYVRIDSKLDQDGLDTALGKEDGAKMAKHLSGLRKLDNANRKNIARLAQIGERLGASFFERDEDAESLIPRSFDPWRAAP